MALTIRHYLAAVATASCRRALLLGALLSLLCLNSGNSEVLTAVNITWSSINFKTLLQWDPKPTGYTYTVQIDGGRSDAKKACINIAKTECDVTKLLEEVRDTYEARIYSVVPYNDENSDPDEYYEVSPKFTPYRQTEIGMPTVEDFAQDDDILKVVVKDPVTPYRFKNGSFKSIRDIFKHDLEYTLNYWKDQSTGKKISKTKSNQFEINIDRGKNYCFYVQATIPSRSHDRTGQKSIEKCTSVQRLDGLELDAILIIVGIAVGILTVIIILSVTIYKCTKPKYQAKEKEHVPLNA